MPSNLADSNSTVSSLRKRAIVGMEAAMYWSPSQFPSLVDLPRAEREAILRSAPKEK